MTEMQGKTGRRLSDQTSRNEESLFIVYDVGIYFEHIILILPVALSQGYLETQILKQSGAF